MYGGHLVLNSAIPIYGNNLLVVQCMDINPDIHSCTFVQLCEYFFIVNNLPVLIDIHLSNDYRYL